MMSNLKLKNRNENIDQENREQFIYTNRLIRNSSILLVGDSGIEPLTPAV